VKAVRISEFGPPESMKVMDVPVPSPGAGEVLVRVRAAGVGPWDAWVRSGNSAMQQTLPLTPGADISGVVEAIGSGVHSFQVGDEVFGATNPDFVGGYAEFAVANADMIALKPRSLDFLAAASVPVVAVTALQMVFEYGKLASSQSVLILGGAGNVGAYAVQLAKKANLMVAATCDRQDVDFVKSLGAETVIEREQPLAAFLKPVDAIIDTVGGDARDRAAAVLKRGGTLVSSASAVPKSISEHFGIKTVFFLVQVTTERLAVVGSMFDRGELDTNVGTVLPLGQAVRAHQMLAGAPHRRGKIVLQI